jgi:hypothetical protein
MKGMHLGMGLLIPLAFAGSAAWADDPIVLKANREVAVTATGLYTDYQEIRPTIVGPVWTDSGVDLDSRTGWSPGVNLTWSDVFEPSNGRPSLYVRAVYQYYDWTINHNNYSMAGVIGKPERMPVKINDSSAELGVAKIFGDRELLAGFFEVEYFDWQRVLADAANYKEDYSFTAPGAGVRATIALSERLALSGKLGFEYTDLARVAGSGDAATPAIAFKLGSHFLGQGSVGLDYALSRCVALKLGFDFSHFAFGHSRVDHPNGGTGTIWEPDSATNEGITQLGVAWTY